MPVQASKNPKSPRAPPASPRHDRRRPVQACRASWQWYARAVQRVCDTPEPARQQPAPAPGGASRPRLALALEYPLGQQGGTEVLVRALVRGLSPFFEIVLVSGDRERPALEPEMRGLVADHLFWEMDAADSGPGRTLAAELSRRRVRLAHFHFGGTFTWQSNRFWRCPIPFLARAGVPCLATNHLASQWLACGVNPERPAWQKHLLQVFALFSRSLVYHRLKFEVCVSRQDRRRVARMFPQFRHKLIQRYHSLLPADAPPPNLADREPVVLCVGTIGGRKAQPILAEAFARLAQRHPAWRLELIGRVDVAADARRVADCAAAHGIADRIRLLGRLDDAETLARMKRASLFALPSLQEGLGLSLQEALFHGCVGVGSRAGGIPELINHEVNGLLTPPGDVAALSAALDRLFSDAPFREKLRTQARPSILRKGMTAAAMVANYRDLYQQCVPGL